MLQTLDQYWLTLVWLWCLHCSYHHAATIVQFIFRLAIQSLFFNFSSFLKSNWLKNVQLCNAVVVRIKPLTKSFTYQSKLITNSLLFVDSIPPKRKLQSLWIPRPSNLAPLQQQLVYASQPVLSIIDSWVGSCFQPSIPGLTPSSWKAAVGVSEQCLSIT